jgi:hypothetical protein
MSAFFNVYFASQNQTGNDASAHKDGLNGILVMKNEYL